MALPSLPAARWLAGTANADTPVACEDSDGHLGTGLSAGHLAAVRRCCEGAQLVVFNLFALVRVWCGLVPLLNHVD